MSPSYWNEHPLVAGLIGALIGALLAGVIVLRVSRHGATCHPCDEAAFHPPVVEVEPAPPVAELEPMPVPADEAPDEPACLDEVGCMLADTPPACCVRYRGGAAPPTDERLDPTVIQAGVTRVRPAIRACAQPDVHGTVILAVKVGAGGRPLSVSATSGPEPLATCAATAMKKARFTPTRFGGSFTYPFSF